MPDGIFTLHNAQLKRLVDKRVRSSEENKRCIQTLVQDYDYNFHIEIDC
jgi:hypothetical protein